MLKTKNYNEITCGHLQIGLESSLFQLTGFVSMSQRHCLMNKFAPRAIWFVGYARFWADER